MTPKLLSVTGPRKGAVFRLGSGELRIGRDPSSEIALVDAAVSRAHSMVVGESGTFHIRDLGSMNGTFLNGVPVKERALQHGDEIGVGLSRFLFLVEDDMAPREGERPELRARETVQLRPEEALYADPERVADVLRGGDVARGVAVLLKVGRVLHASRSLEDLAGRLAPLILESFAVRRAAALFFGAGPNEIHHASWRDAAGGDAPAEVSRSVLSEITRGGVAVLSNDVVATLRGAPSLVGPQVRALIAAPILSAQRLEGVLYADSDRPDAKLDDRDLELLAAMGTVVAPAAANLRQLESLAADRRRLQDGEGHGWEIVGESASMARLHEQLARVAPSDSTVLVLGESGTGKELLARAIHRASRRADGPLVVINCGALSEALLESELFGHEKGAFTGAVARKHGKLEIADKGTVFLDEVGELSPALQAKLLRFLQEREIDRVGGTLPIRVDVRLIAATNRDLAAMVKDGSFRLDLYYRLNVVTLELPPLRERAEDIRLLASFFLARHARLMNKKTLGLTAEAWECLLRHDWPGNVRELENAMERAVVLGLDEWVHPEDLPASLLEKAAGNEGSGTSFQEIVNAAKKAAVADALAASGGVVTEAAKRLGLHPNYLHRLMRNLGMRPSERP